MTDLPIFGSGDELMAGIFRRYFARVPDVGVHYQYSEDLKPPFIVAKHERKSGTMGLPTEDDRFLRAMVFGVVTITSGPDADALGEQLQEACAQAIRTAHQEQWVIPNGGSISVVENSSLPTKVNDWATSTSVVQYASLPEGWARYESIYRLLVRPPRQDTITNPYIAP